MVVTDIIEIAPCTLTVQRGQGTLRSVVGSGVSVCLFDRRSCIAGMAHYIFPRTTDPQKATARYGNAALIGLLRLLEQEDQHIEVAAHLAGGAYCDEFEIDAALENVRIAWRFLIVKNIPIVSQSIGGHVPREVLFDVETCRFTTKSAVPPDSE